MASDFRKKRLAYARSMVDTLEDQLRTGAGLVNVNTDGLTVTMNRQQALKELEYWRKQVIRLQRGKSRTSSIYLGNG